MRRVALFVPCYMSTLRPGDAGHAARVLQALGDDVTSLDGRCCGQPAFNSGFRPEARKVGTELLRDARSFEAVVTPSGSCTAMVQHYLPSLFEAREAGARAITHRFVEFSEYVAKHPNLPSLPLRLTASVAYHDSCHARRELGLTNRTVGLLEQIEGLDLRRLAFEEECCGFGGTFSIKMPEVSAGIMAARLEDIAASGARVLISGDLSCLAHLEAGARGLGQDLETWTIAELLSQALA